MTSAETDTEWAGREPQRSFIGAPNGSRIASYSIDELEEAMLALALTMASKMHGPRPVAARLLILADKFASEANRLEREARDAAIN